MKIWIDGDACPNKIKDILFKAALRKQILTTIVANHYVKIPPSPFIKRIIVASGFDVADTKIISMIEKKDLVITADIPLADSVIAKKAIALSPRGKLYNENNIKQALAMRDLYTSLRDNSIHQTKVPKISSTDVQQFANQLDCLLK